MSDAISLHPFSRMIIRTASIGAMTDLLGQLEGESILAGYVRLHDILGKEGKCGAVGNEEVSLHTYFIP